MNTKIIVLVALGIITFAGGYFLLSSQQTLSNIQNTVSYDNITIEPIEHASLVLRWDKDVLVFDPTGDADRYGDVDAVFITDIHGDHLSTSTLQALDTEDAHLVVPQAVMDALGGSVYFGDIEVMANGEEEPILDYTVKAVAMYNVPEAEDSFHPKGRGNGYVVEKDGVRVYVAGDTGNHRLIRGLQDIDIAFVPMNEPYTMTVEDAAKVVLAFQPKIVYPYHYRGKDEYSDVEMFKQIINRANPNIDVRLANWYPERELGTSLIDSLPQDDTVRTEFEKAAAVGTTDSYQVFIKSHRDHPLAKEARFELNKLRGIKNN